MWSSASSGGDVKVTPAMFAAQAQRLWTAASKRFRSLQCQRELHMVRYLELPSCGPVAPHSSSAIRPDLDFLLHGSNSWVFTTGWQEDMTEEEFLQVMNQLDFYPVKAHRHHTTADGSSSFFMKFEQMDGAIGAKRAMKRLKRLKWRWRIKQTVPFFAYARRIDVHRACEDRHEDELSDADSDIDEPIHY